MLPNLEKLEADITTIERLKGFPLGRILGSAALSELAVSRDRSILAKVMRSRFVEIDWRIRFVEGVAGGVPKGTMKLFSVSKAVTAPSGHRILALLDGGVVAVPFEKRGVPRDWRVSAVRRFLPQGHELERHEQDLDSLLRIFSENPTGRLFRATTIGVFQLRTGPGGYAFYLMAQEYFPHC